MAAFSNGLEMTRIASSPPEWSIHYIYRDFRTKPFVLQWRELSDSWFHHVWNGQTHQVSVSFKVSSASKREQMLLFLLFSPEQVECLHLTPLCYTKLSPTSPSDLCSKISVISVQSKRVPTRPQGHSAYFCKLWYLPEDISWVREVFRGEDWVRWCVYEGGESSRSAHKCDTWLCLMRCPQRARAQTEDTERSWGGKTETVL